MTKHNHEPRCCCEWDLNQPYGAGHCPACPEHGRYQPPPSPIRTPVRILLAVGTLLLLAAACWSVYLLTEM